ncbi:hypothetical protein D3273_27065 [Lichenibacterium minor]|uniref:Uncharacterized protein n=1 Tax=Lichenibacterium minor TaxID=2316528 RepID=A0A4Q2U2F3_9HYPH|nr:hypothetical protein [Lichenibacterium minor]RYC28856.1 hypothetical protein D3273_27065 [Lichenibacterium minor]
MAIAIKLIWRFDFTMNYSFLDRYGSTAKAIFTTVPEFFSQIGEGAPRTALVGSFGDTSFGRNITMDITTLSGTMEWRHGTDLSRLANDFQFRKMNQIADELIRLNEIRNILRGGFRLFFLIPKCPKWVRKDGFMDAVHKDLAEGVQSTLGRADDIAFIFEGRDQDLLSYRLSVGPFAEKNVSIAFDGDMNISKELLSSKPKMFFDLDLSEQGFSLSQGSLYKWSRTKLEKAVKLATLFDQLGE